MKKFEKELIQKNSIEKEFSKVSKAFIEFFSENKIGILNLTSEEYPFLLKQIPNKPKLLFSRGDYSLLDKKLITVVGSRSMTRYGFNIIKKIFSSEYLKDDYALVSGFAYGVDISVHKIALENNIPTIVVLPCAIDEPYPLSHSKIYDEIIKSNLVLSEFPPGRQMFKGMFPMRNRILAGLSPVTVVVEAAERSGSLITAKAALDYDRDVYAVPGSVFSNASVGCNKLIQDGAGVLLGVGDLVDNICLYPDCL